MTQASLQSHIPYSRNMKSYVISFLCLLCACSVYIVMFSIDMSGFHNCWLSEKVRTKTSESYSIGENVSMKKDFNSANDTSQIKLPDHLNCSGIHKLSCEEPYFSRLLRVQKECKKKPPQNYNLLSFHYKFSDKFKLIMCETPKVGSTTLQNVLVGLDSSFRERDTWTDKHECGAWGNKCFTELTEEEARLRTNTYTSFLISRHPLERVVSAYIDKLKANNSYFRSWVGKPAALQQASLHLHEIGLGEDFREMEVKKIKNLKSFKKLSSFHRQEVLNYVSLMKTGAISFAQLVRFLVHHFVEGKVDQIDRHWKPQVDICQPCAFNYSCIMRFNDLAKDTNRMWDYVVDYQKFNISKADVYIKMKKTKAVNNAVATEYYKQVPENHVQILRDLYKDDFIFYNYNPYLYHGY